MFRAANERMAAWEEHHADEKPELYFCECADEDCRKKLLLRSEDYESIRSDSRRFLVAVGHDVPDLETVIEEHGDWVMIEKDPEVDEIVRSTDPRRSS
jgi:hypothetical protein